MRVPGRKAPISGSSSLNRQSRWTRLDELSLCSAAMQTINIHEAKTHLSRLVDQAANGEPFVIAKAGKPLVKVVALGAPEAGQVKRVGFLSGQISVPDDFDQMGSREVEKLFNGDL